MNQKNQTPYIDYDQRIEVPPHIKIIDINGEELTLSLNIWIDYDNNWHAGYKNWLAEAPMHEDSCLIDAGLRSCCLMTVLESLKNRLKLSLFYEMTAISEHCEKGGER